MDTGTLTDSQAQFILENRQKLISASVDAAGEDRIVAGALPLAERILNSLEGSPMGESAVALVIALDSLFAEMLYAKKERLN